ncbi:NAF domain-containing protein [Artemisia annua]|uniref:non-specific serine/threonine protein kinase n=1 Tax=Artemisia annua TaxID=35608 RepID=A0A2U1Q147_ARTAN|nr:NAF domain-containing protein [Artemisia annua]
MASSRPSRTRVGRYELGRTLGEGTFAKVKFARNVETGENVAIKILDKEKVLKHKMINQIKREISTMKLIRHPNVIRMHEVMASKTKIYIVLEFVTGGELFDKIATRGRLKEDEARKYFQQLINAVDYCHSRGVCHRDLKPENLLLDASGCLKVSDFGLSALPQQVREDGLLHTTCGTPNYVAPEVINNKGYDGAKADLWSCGVILFVLMAGYLPFEESNLMALYKKIFKADFSCPPWFSASAKKLIKRILDPNPETRITTAEVIENEWFKKGYVAPRFEQEEISLVDVDAIFNEASESPILVVERRDERPSQPVTMNAFELISKSQGLNLSSLFEKQMGLVKRETRFTSKCPANEIISKIEEAAGPLGFDVKKNNYKLKLQGEKSGRKGHLSVATEIFEVAPSLHMVEVRKAGGDTLEFHKFYKNLSTGLKDIVWRNGDEANGDLPESNLMALYKKIFKADFSCPPWFSASAKKLIKRILDPNPETRITTAEVIENEWFKKGYVAPRFEQEEISLVDVDAIFNEASESPILVVERRDERPSQPVTMNAFELISKSQGLNLSSLFEKQMGLVKRETRFTSKCPANEIISKIEEAAGPLGFDVKKNNYKLKLQGEKSGRKGHLSVATEIFEVAPSLHMVEVRKAGGDTLEFHKFYKNLSTGLKDIVWRNGDEANGDLPG